MRGQPPRARPQPLVGGDRHVGEQVQRRRRGRRAALVERGLVELTDLRRDLVELLVPPGEIARARRCAAVACGLGARRPAPGGLGLPPAASPPSARRRRRRAAGSAPNTDSYSSRTTSSGARGHDSTSRIRPDSATSAASSPTCQSVTGRARGAAASAVGDAGRCRCAPRTDEPIRTSGCSRVRRTSSTTVGAASRSGTSARLCRATIAVSSARRLVAHRDAAGAVVDGGGDARRADRVERVHRGDQPEARRGADPARAAARAARPRSSR